VEYVLQADTYEDLGRDVGVFMAKASQLGYLLNLDSDLRLNKPQLEIDIDRERAASLGVSVTEIGSALESLLGGRVVTDFKRGSKQYDVITQLETSQRARPDVVNEIYVRGETGLVQLANVVKVRETVAPKELNHYNRIRASTISAQLAGGRWGQVRSDASRSAGIGTISPGSRASSASPAGTSICSSCSRWCSSISCSRRSSRASSIRSRFCCRFRWR
jgi:multidrug efflux pump subunit AcrB